MNISGLFHRYCANVKKHCGAKSSQRSPVFGGDLQLSRRIDHEAGAEWKTRLADGFGCRRSLPHEGANSGCPLFDRAAELLTDFSGAKEEARLS
jgi:hypothetical protein